MSNDKKAKPMLDETEKKAVTTAIPHTRPLVDAVESKRKRGSHRARILSIIPKPVFVGKRARPPTYLLETSDSCDPLDSETVKLFREVSANMEVKVQFGVTSLAAWQSATTDIRSFTWDPTTNAQFILLAGLFSQYTLDAYEVEFLTDMPAGINGSDPVTFKNYSPQTFLVCDDPGIMMSSITETEMCTMTGFQAYNLSRVSRAVKHTVGREKLLLANAQSVALQPGGWSPTSSTWYGQTVTFARTPTGSGTPGTEQYLRGYVRWNARFRNHFDV